MTGLIFDAATNVVSLSIPVFMYLETYGVYFNKKRNKPCFVVNLYFHTDILNNA